MLFIVARDQPLLYASLRREFAQEREVAVVFDRRQGERRQGVTALPPERREADRRTRADVQQELRVLGWVLVHQPAERAAR